jgi:hypothetical protein
MTRLLVCISVHGHAELLTLTCGWLQLLRRRFQTWRLDDCRMIQISVWLGGLATLAIADVLDLLDLVFAVILPHSMLKLLNLARQLFIQVPQLVDLATNQVIFA